MKVIEPTISSADELGYWIDDRPYEVVPHGERDTHIAVCDFDTEIVAYTHRTKDSYLNQSDIEANGVKLYRSDEYNAKPSSILSFDKNSNLIMVYDHTVSGYDILQAGTEYLGISVEKMGNDIEIAGQKVYGVANHPTHAWMIIGQLGPLQLPMDTYVNLPDEKFADKDAKSVDERVTSLSEAVGETVTAADVATAIRQVV